ncbi:MAG: T9SS type A sorting domain-containing protein [Bacteroidia bacterium]|nr:T9SS type A sorting domain-containing protein [Bacteroidia bacterium]
MNRLFLLLLTGLLLCHPFYSWAQAPNPNDSLNLFDTSTTLEDVLQNFESVATDEREGGTLSYFKFLQQFWGDRVVKNDQNANATTGVNMFSQYRSQLSSALKTQQSTGCGVSGFQGNWRLKGPIEMPLQKMGKIDAIWASKNGQDTLLAGCMGGLFKTTNGGDDWFPLTDGFVLANGIVGVSSIAVDPTNHNNIYLGTSGDEHRILSRNSLGIHWLIGGAGILHSADGGATWTQETIANNSVMDEIQRVQLVKITPDGNRLYAFAHNRVYTRLVSSSTWQEITPPVASTFSGYNDGWDYLDMEFVPGNQNHFFVSGRYLDANGAPRAMIWESNVAVPGTSNWTEITTQSGSSLSYTVSSTTFVPHDIVNYKLSIPSSDTLFVMAMAYAKGTVASESSCAILKYNLNGTHQWTHLGTLPPFILAAQYCMSFEVSDANTSQNNNQKVIYAGTAENFMSWDNGRNFHRIGNYHPTTTARTHGDIRAVFLHTASNSVRGQNDVVFFATDGGVSKKEAGSDPQANTISTTIDISGRGLAAGTFWGLSTSEHEGLIYSGSMHNGKFAFETGVTPNWINLTSEDAYTTVFDKNDRTRAYGIAGFGSFDRSVSVGANNRLINNQLSSFALPEPGGNLEMPLSSTNNNTHFMGIQNLWRSTIATPGNTTWTQVMQGLPTTGQGVRSVAFSEYYTMRGYVLYNHNSNGQDFYYRDANLNNGDFISVTVPAANHYPLTDVTCDPRTPERVWVSMGGINWATQAANRVKYSPDRGQTWYAVDKGLPVAMPVTDIIFHEGANMVYCATDVGIFRADFDQFDVNAPDNGIEWQCFSKAADGVSHFPYGFVTKLRINNCEGKLYASTYGRSIWETDLYNTAVNPQPTEHVTSNTTWSNNTYIKTGIVISNGATLTIQNGTTPTTVFMPKDGRIIIEPGAKLVVNDATITNGCEGCMWDGIYVKGDPSSMQVSINQGTVELNNATISHAKKAISNHSPYGFSWLSTGGIIRANGTTFLNNAVSVSLQRYIYNRNWSLLTKIYKANFVNCVFDIDDEFKGGTTSRFTSHVEMFEVNGPSFVGCDFKNRNTSKHYFGEGNGISSNDCGFTVRAYCDPWIYPCTYVRSQFSGLHTGVFVESKHNGLYVAKIDRADFTSCGIGIRSVNTNHLVAIRNSFEMGYGKTTFLDAFDCHKNIGIWSSQTYFPIIEDNDFKGFTHAGQHINHENIGVIMDDCSYTDKQIYNNTFTDLKTACFARGVNSGGLPWKNSYGQWKSTGLRFICNEYEGNTYDILSVDKAGHPPNTIMNIAYNQGTEATSAGNEFNDLLSDNHFVINHFYNRNIYFYRGTNTQPNINPTFLTPRYLQQSFATNACASNYSGGGGVIDIPMSGPTLTAQKADFQTYRSTVKSLQANLDGLIDNGSTDQLVADILSATHADTVSLIADLTGYSPYLSSTVLETLASADLISTTSLISLLEQNPEMLRNDELLEHLEFNIPSPLSPLQIDNLRVASENPSERTGKESELDHNQLQMNLRGELITTHYLLDTNANSIDSISDWLDTINTLQSNYQKVAFHIGNGDFMDAELIWNDMPVNFNMSSSELDEYNLFVQYWMLLKSVNDDGRTVLELNQTEIEELENIQNDPIATGKQIEDVVKVTINPNEPAAHLPCNLTAEPIDHAEPKATSSSDKPRGLETAENKNLVQAYPNPADQQVTFEFDLEEVEPNSVLRITNTNGQVVKSFIMNDFAEGEIRWNSQSAQPGVYFFEVKTNETLLQSGGIIIAR